MKNILAIFAHPDDEILACGGTLKKRIMSGDKVYILILSNGCGSRDTKENEFEVKKRIVSCKNASDLLGFEVLDIGNFKDNSFDASTLLEIVKYIENKTFKIKPQEIFTHFNGDLNLDHRITFKAVITAFRPHIINNSLKILQSEINSSTECLFDKKIFFPNHFENIDKTIDLKIKAMNFYKQELRSWPHPRSIKGIKTLASYRGMQSSFNYAEAFSIYFSKN